MINSSVDWFNPSLLIAFWCYVSAYIIDWRSQQDIAVEISVKDQGSEWAERKSTILTGNIRGFRLNVDQFLSSLRI